MNYPSETTTPQELRIILELVAEDIYEEDLSLTKAIGRDVSTALRADGYQLRPLQKGTRGGDVLVEVVKTLSDAAATAWEHREEIEWALNSSVSLIAIISTVAPIVKKIVQSHKKHARQDSEPVKITVTIGDATISVETSDPEQAETTALQIVQKIVVEHPNSKPEPVKIQGKIPRQRRRKKK